MTALLAIVIAYFVLKNPQILQGFGASLTTPAGSSLQWPPQAGQPGYVTVGGSPAPSGFSAGNLSTAQQAGSLAGAGLGITTGLASTGAFTLSAAAATAVTGIGLVIGAAGLVIGMISRHHQEMVAKEAAELNQAVPLTMQRFTLIVQGVVRGILGDTTEITSVSHADQLLQQAIADYYAVVKPMCQGRWPMVVGAKDSYPPTQGHLEKMKPSSCNGPCEVGHFLEMVSAMLHDAISAMFSGATASSPPLYPSNFVIQNGHGTIFLHQIPAHAGFQGFPEVDITV